MTERNTTLSVEPQMARIVDMNGDEAKSPASDVVMDNLVKTVVAKAQKTSEIQRIMAALEQAKMQDIHLSGEAHGVLRAMGFEGSLQEAVQNNWRGLADKVKELLK